MPPVSTSRKPRAAKAAPQPKRARRAAGAAPARPTARPTAAKALAAAPAGAPAKATISLTEEIYRLLKWRILSMELAPGTLINEQGLVEATGFGRAPIHQALHRLQYDGLVEIRPRKGAQVKAWSPHDLAHLMEARLPLEIAMVRLAAERASERDIRALRAKLKAGPQLVKASDREGLMRLDHEFHQSLARFAQSPVLAELVENLHHRSTLLWYLPLSGPSEYLEVLAEHERILAAVEQHDPDQAALAMSDHLSSLKATLT
jgi:DNA-binding GntR family transcriptional regulator